MQIPDTEDWRSYSFANRPNATNQLQFQHFARSTP
ncbi:hypothetical protein ACTXQV_66720 [Klebsiella pneumoniae]